MTSAINDQSRPEAHRTVEYPKNPTTEKRDMQRIFSRAKRVDEKVRRHHAARSRIPGKPERTPQHAGLTGTSFLEVDVMWDQQGEERGVRGCVRDDRHHLFPVCCRPPLGSQQTTDFLTKKLYGTQKSSKSQQGDTFLNPEHGYQDGNRDLAVINHPTYRNINMM
jgi:hypothetical protein